MCCGLRQGKACNETTYSSTLTCRSFFVLQSVALSKSSFLLLVVLGALVVVVVVLLLLLLLSVS